MFLYATVTRCPEAPNKVDPKQNARGNTFRGRLNCQLGKPNQAKPILTEWSWWS